MKLSNYAVHSRNTAVLSLLIVLTALMPIEKKPVLYIIGDFPLSKTMMATEGTITGAGVHC
jgi:hypothetical protein